MIIYHGDCAAGPGVHGWPVEFETKAGSNRVLFVLKREKP